MKHVLSTILAVAVILLGACTTNDGDLGFLGGHWRLDSITLDGTDDTAYEGNITWSFQSNIVEMSVLLPNHGRANYFGTWQFTDDTLTLDYTHSDNDHPAATGEYALPPQLHLPRGVKVPLHLTSQHGGKMVLTGTGADGLPVMFHLSKIY